MDEFVVGLLVRDVADAIRIVNDLLHEAGIERRKDLKEELSGRARLRWCGVRNLIHHHAKTAYLLDNDFCMQFVVFWHVDEADLVGTLEFFFATEHLT